MDQLRQPEAVDRVDKPDNSASLLPFSYEDDRWDLSYRETMAITDGASVINFEEFPASWKEEVKAYAAEAILARRLSNGWLKSTLTTLRLLVKLAGERHPMDVPPTLLDRQDARRLEQHVGAQEQVKGRQTIRTAAVFADFIRERHKGEPASFRPEHRGIPGEIRNKTYSDGWERVIPDEVSTSVLQAVQSRWSVLIKSSSGKLRTVQFNSLKW